MAKTEFYCPYCFRKIKTCDLVYRDRKCQEVVKRTPTRMERWGLSAPPRSIPCPEEVRKKVEKANPQKCRVCSRNITQRICPLCSGNLPYAIDELSDITIAIIGARGAGKSHYVALLVERIKQMFESFHWVLQSLTEETDKRYADEFYNPLFNAQVPLQSTRRGQVEPLIYSLRFLNSNKRVLLVFFDAAGEHFSNAMDVASMNRYIGNAAGIICLMDPLQLQNVRRELEGRMNLPAQDEGANTIINNVKNLFEELDKRGASGTKKIRTPLAVAFSKMDALRNNDPGYSGNILFDENSSLVYQQSTYDGCLREDELESIHGTLEAWLREVNPKMLHDCKNDFEKFKIFGFSALGDPPTANNSKLQHEPRPYRVEDPFLWILAQNGLIKIK